MIWQKKWQLSELNQRCENSAIAHLGIHFTAQGENWLEGCVAVNHRTTQPFGALHGGITATLAETLASAAGLLSCDHSHFPVGTELNISHLKAITQGNAIGRATPLHLGKSSQVWQVEIRNEAQQCCAVARVSLRLIKLKSL